MKTVVKWLFGLWVGSIFANVLLYGSAAFAEALVLAFPGVGAVEVFAVIIQLLGVLTGFPSIFIIARMIVRGFDS